MIDLHSHILFNVDDGARNIDESIEMVKTAKEIGFEKIIATPHYIIHSDFNSTYDNNLNQLMELKDKVEGVGIELFLGNEIFYDPESIKSLDNGDACTINKTKYVLIEIPRSRVHFDSLLRYIFDLQIKGWIPILAHPERYDFVIDNPSKLIELIQRGVYIQLNLLSIYGRYGDKVKKTARILLEHNMVHFFGSDAHKAKHYLQLADTIIEVKEIIGEEKFKEISHENPSNVLNDKVFYPEEPMMVKKKRGLLGLLGINNS